VLQKDKGLRKIQEVVDSGDCGKSKNFRIDKKSSKERGCVAATSKEAAKQPGKNDPAVENGDVEEVSNFSHKRSSLAGVEIYETRWTTNDKDFEIQDWRGGGVLGG